MSFIGTLSSLLAAVIVGTWNGNWFPSGRAEHRAHPAVEASTITASAKLLAHSLATLDPDGTNDLILCFNEMRSPDVVSNLVAQIGRTNLAVAVVSRYRRRDRFDQQQDAIATTLPVVATEEGMWTASNGVKPPRGFASASVVVSPAVTSVVFAVHLKANYGATTEEIAEDNRNKRTEAIAQLLEKVTRQKSVIVAGDMNADPWRKEFAAEELFNRLEEAHFVDVLSLLPPNRRGTHPTRSYGNSALDHIFLRGLAPVGTPAIFPSEDLSDHSFLFQIITE